MSQVYDVRRKVVFVGGKEVVVDNAQVHALFALGEGIQRDTQKAFSLYKAIDADTRKKYRKAAEVVFSRMTVNIWERAIEDNNVALFLEKSPAVAQAFASIDDNNPAKGDFVALGKQAIETKGGVSKFVADVRKENARYRDAQTSAMPAEEQVKALLKEKKALLEKLAAISAKIAELQGK